MKQPTLYKKTSTGAIQEWTISTEGSTIVTKFGQKGGAIQTATDVITKGKNPGKKNETTAVQQAELEAMSQFEKKLKKGYVLTLADAEAGKVDEVIEGGVFPMLAHKFSEQAQKITYPALAQPKFDGHRCIAVIADGKASLWSRTRKVITGLPHLIRELEAMVAKLRIQDLILDGELYNHAYKAKFEELTSFIRNPEPKEGHEVVQYHIYDIVDMDRIQFDRYKNLNLFSQAFGPSLVAVQTLEIASEDDLMLAFDQFLGQGYEGLMVRNAQGRYVNKRSYDLQKVKEFDDAEFPVTGVEEGRGKLAGHAIFVCTTKDGAEFRAKMKGKLTDLKQYFDNPKLALGRQLQIRYQGITNKTLVPRFPVAIRFRDEP